MAVACPVRKQVILIHAQASSSAWAWLHGGIISCMCVMHDCTLDVLICDAHSGATVRRGQDNPGHNLRGPPQPPAAAGGHDHGEHHVLRGCHAPLRPGHQPRRRGRAPRPPGGGAVPPLQQHALRVHHGHALRLRAVPHHHSRPHPAGARRPAAPRAASPARRNPPRGGRPGGGDAVSCTIAAGDVPSAASAHGADRAAGRAAAAAAAVGDGDGDCSHRRRPQLHHGACGGHLVGHGRSSASGSAAYSTCEQHHRHRRG
jgi:hypothetical protein